MERKQYLRGLGLGIIVTALIMGTFVKGGDTMTDEEVIKRAKELGMIEDTLLVEATEETETEEDAADLEASEEEEAKSAETDSEESGLTETDLEETDLEETDLEEAGLEEPDSEEGNSEETMPQQEASVVEEETARDTETDTDTKKKTDAEDRTQTAETMGNDAAVSTDQIEQTDQISDAGGTGQASAAETQIITIVSGDSSVSVASKLQQAGLISSVSSYDAYLCAGGYDKKIRTGTYTIPADAGDEEIARIITGMTAQP